MTKTFLIIQLAWFLTGIIHAQSILMNKGFEELMLDITENDLDQIIGFQGKSYTPDEYYATEATGRNIQNLPEHKKGFDRCIIYKHIMPIPVTRVYITDKKVTMIEISSYPDFTRPICLDSRTKEGLKFWDTTAAMIRLYGKSYREDASTDKNMNFYYYDSLGIGFGVSNNEIRVIYYY